MLSTQSAKQDQTPVVGANAVTCRWIDDFTLPLQYEAADLMNLVLTREDTIGFPGPLTTSEALKWMNQTANAIKNGFTHCLLFFDAHNEVVGHVLLTRSELPNCQHIGEISRTFIHPDYRNPGVIRKGLRAVIEKSEEIGIDVLKLDVRAKTRIALLWQTLGYEVIGEMRDYARVNGKSYSGLLMSQHVSVLRSRLEKVRSQSLTLKSA